MSKHQITIEVELTDTNGGAVAILDAIAEGMVRNACEDYGITEYDYGQPKGSGGYGGPFIVSARRVLP